MLTRLRMIVPMNTHQAWDRRFPWMVMMLAASQLVNASMAALITRVNNPRVTIVIGRENNLQYGGQGIDQAKDDSQNEETELGRQD